MIEIDTKDDEDWDWWMSVSPEDFDNKVWMNQQLFAQVMGWA